MAEKRTQPASAGGWLPDRLPPQHLDAEQAVLGASVISSKASRWVIDNLARIDYYLEAHRKIHDVLVQLADNDAPIDTLTVIEELRRRGQLDQVGGVSYILQLSDSVPTAAHVGYYGKLVSDSSTARQVIEACGEVTAMAYDQEYETIDQLLDTALTTMMNLSLRRVRTTFTPIRQGLFDLSERLENLQGRGNVLTGVTSGFEPIDQMTHGFQRGDLIIVAARPSMGKTALCTQFAVNCGAYENRPAAIFSLEMPKEQVIARMLCARARVDWMRLRTGYLMSGPTEETNDWERIGRAIGYLGDLPIFIDDDITITVPQISAKLRALKAEVGDLGIVIIDYIQLIRGHKKYENRNVEISDIARMLKTLGRELDVPIVALAQLSRQTERREDKRPQLSDLRESGSLEAEADLVMGIYRDRYYRNNEDEGETPEGQALVEEAEVIFLKHRNGPTGTARLAFQRRYATFDVLHHEREFGQAVPAGQPALPSGDEEAA